MCLMHTEGMLASFSSKTKMSLKECRIKTHDSESRGQEEAAVRNKL